MTRRYWTLVIAAILSISQISQGEERPSPAAKSAAESGIAVRQTAPPMLKFDFRLTPWSDVLKQYAEAAGLVLDLNDVPPGTFSYSDQKSYTIAEGLNVLNAALLSRGFTIIRRDKFLVVLAIDSSGSPGRGVELAEALPQQARDDRNVKSAVRASLEPPVADSDQNAVSPKAIALPESEQRVVSFQVMIVDFATKKAEGAEANRQPGEFEAPQLSGTVEQVTTKLASMAISGEVSTVKKYRLTVQNGKRGEFSFSETRPMVTGVTMNGSTRLASPTLVMRDIGTMITVKPQIAGDDIVVDVMMADSRISPQETWVELGKGENGPIYTKGITTTRLTTTLKILSGQTSMAMASKSDQAPCAVIVAAQIGESATADRAVPDAGATRPATRPTPDQEGRRRFGGASFSRVPTLYSSLRTDEGRDRLKLTEEQREKVAKLQTEMMEEFRSAFSDPEKRSNLQALTQGFEKKHLELLDDEQKQLWAKWEAELKKEADERMERRRGSPGGGSPGAPINPPGGNPGF